MEIQPLTALINGIFLKIIKIYGGHERSLKNRKIFRHINVPRYTRQFSVYVDVFYQFV